MKWRSISSVMSKSAITPSLSGRIAWIEPGVRPSIRFASTPTACTSPVLESTATTEGSESTIPRPRTYTSVFAVPRSTAMSRPPKPVIEEKMPMTASESTASFARLPKALTLSSRLRVYLHPMNSVNLIGNLATDVELREVGDEKKVASFLLAVGRGSRDGSADFVWISAWERQGEACAEYL